MRRTPAISRRRAVAIAGSGLLCVLAGCLGGVGGDPSGGDDPSDDTAECADATIEAVDLTASTAGDTIVVRLAASDLPAPALRGRIVTTDAERHVKEIRREPSSVGESTSRFEFSHHAIEEYDFRLADCPDAPTGE